MSPSPPDCLRILNPDVLPMCCGTLMMLTDIVPDKPGHERRAFECPTCAHAETFVVKFS